MQTDPKFRLWHNLVSMAGLTIAAMAVVLLVTFGIFVLVSPWHNPYVDIFGYMILPMVLIFGLAIVPLGMWLHYRALTNRGVIGKWIAGLRIDLANPFHQRMALAFLALNLFVVFPIVGVSGYHGYHYTESTEFCANVCHAVMEPQGVTHAISPHARVACAECHIGSGAGWFVKSKLSGLHQVIAVFRDSYERPIPPAITDLRPARETCEQCHWPAKFHGSQLKEVVHFSSDEANTKRVVKMLLKTGGADESIGRIEGIHMHMALSGPIDYVAIDPHLQEIPWVKYTRPDGVEVVYRSDGRPHAEPPPEGVARRVDCMDCHNRGAHHHRSPQQSVDLYLHSGVLDVTLPYIKREAVAALTAGSKAEGEPHEFIAEQIKSFYAREYPQLARERAADIDLAVTKVAELYDISFFPHMKVDWRAYPDNVGHMQSSGCFRCHDGQHVDATGRALPSDCNVCHTFLNPVEGSAVGFVEGEFTHSMSLNLHENLRCDQCHTGGPIPTCRDCHAEGTWLQNEGKDKFEWDVLRDAKPKQ